MKMRLKSKFLTATSLIVMAGVGVLSILAYTKSTEILEKSITHDISQTSGLLSKQVSLWVQSMLSSLQAHADRDEFLKTAAAEKTTVNVTAALTTLQRSNPAFQRVMITNAQGKVLCASTPDSVGVDLSSRSYFKQILEQGTPVVSDVVLGSTDKKPVFTCCIPLKHGDTIVGVLLAAISSDYFSQTFIGPIKAGKEGYAYVLDKTGMIIAHRNPEMVMKVNALQYDWGQRLIKQKDGLFNYVWNGFPKIVAFNTDSLSGWTVGVSANVDDILSDSAVIRNHMLLGGLAVTMILCLALAWLVTTLVTRPLEVIMTFLQRASVGDTSLYDKNDRGIQKMCRRRDEIGDTTRAAGQLQSFIEAKSEEAKAIADGDFTAEIAIASEQDQLGRAFSDMKQRLNHALSQVVELAGQVAEGTNQISGASQSLSSGATETAASLEEINSSILEISKQTKVNAENADQASQLAAGSRESADRGNADVTNMVEAMNEMQHSGQQIAKIVKMIDDIAFQTNLLSLNAAVEAARAGQHGKGFAVVAQEVRSLASRSAKAAQETSVLVEDTVSKLSRGAEIAHNTERSLKAVGADVVKVASILGEIAHASNEQAQGVAQISQGLQQIDQVTQQNTANAEETSSAASALSAQASHLNALMSQFKLEHNGLNDHYDAQPARSTRPMRQLPGGNFQQR